MKVLVIAPAEVMEITIVLHRFTVLWLTFVFPSCFRCSRKAMRLSTCLCFSPCKSHATLKPSNHQCFKTTEVTEVYWIILGVAWCGIGDLTWLVTSFRFFCFFFSLNLNVIHVQYYSASLHAFESIVVLLLHLFLLMQHALTFHLLSLER